MDFCNKTLQYEYLTSFYLKGVTYPDSYIQLISDLCSLKILKETGDLSSILVNLQKKLVSNTGILKDNRVKSYYMGKEDALLTLFQDAYLEAVQVEELYDIAVKQHLLKMSVQMESVANNLESFEELGNAVNSAALENEVLKQRDSTHYDLRIITASLKNILLAHGTGVPFPTKEKYTKYNNSYRLFITDLYYNLTDRVSDALLSMNIATATTEILNSIPKDDLDVYGKDKCNNLVDLLMNPQDYYTKCSREEVDSPQVAQTFERVYPEYLEMYLEMYLDKYSEFDQQKQINFRKCFNLIESQGQLVSMCTASLSNVTQQPTAK